MHKYRGKRLDGGGWVVGSLHTLNGEAKIKQYNYLSGREIDPKIIQLDRTWILTQNLPDFSGWDVRDTFFPYEVDPATVGQATGLKDSSGVKIYNGDISEFAGKRCEVRYWDNMMAFGLYFPCDNKWLHVWDCEDQVLPIEVLGNIHDNPELITSKNDDNGR